MSLQPLPKPPRSLKESAPEVYDYLLELRSDVQSRINDIDKRMQDVGQSLSLQLFPIEQLTGEPYRMRVQNYPRMAYCPDYDGDPALIISDGTGLRAITLGPSIL